MAKRIVVGFFLHAELEAGEAEISAHLDRVDSVKKRADSLGGTLCAFGMDGLAFDFAPDDLEEAIALSVSSSDVDVVVGNDPDASSSPWSVGVACGELERLFESDAFAVPAWGDALVMATLLARAARAGETLVHADLPGIERGDLLTQKARLLRMGRSKIEVSCSTGVRCGARKRPRASARWCGLRSWVGRRW